MNYKEQLDKINFAIQENHRQIKEYKKKIKKLENDNKILQPISKELYHKVKEEENLFYKIDANELKELCAEDPKISLGDLTEALVSYSAENPCLKMNNKSYTLGSKYLKK